MFHINICDDSSNIFVGNQVSSIRPSNVSSQQFLPTDSPIVVHDWCEPIRSAYKWLITCICGQYQLHCYFFARPKPWWLEITSTYPKDFHVSSWCVVSLIQSLTFLRLTSDLKVKWGSGYCISLTVAVTGAESISNTTRNLVFINFWGSVSFHYNIRIIYDIYIGRKRARLAKGVALSKLI